MSLQKEPSFLKRKSHTILILREVLEQLFKSDHPPGLPLPDTQQSSPVQFGIKDVLTFFSLLIFCLLYNVLVLVFKKILKKDHRKILVL